MSKHKGHKVKLFISDTHFPWEKADTFVQLKEAKKLYRPDEIYHVGDIVDQHGLGRWVPNSDAAGNNEELEMALDAVARLAELFPNLKICWGNHDLRFIKKIMGIGIPSTFVRDLREVLQAPPGWQWASHYVTDGVRVFHGDGFSGQNAALNAAQSYRQSCVIGHVHSFAGVQYNRGPNDQIFGMNVGCLIDEKQLAFAYSTTYKNKPVSGYGLLVDGVPYFIPVK
jgi:predicted phosphodiesterase